MKQRIYQIDAFADKVFSGNPAAVCPLDYWLDDSVLQNIAMENNLAETAFYVKDGDRYQIKWFTPTVEVDLCGHATLAAAYVLFYHEQHQGNTLHFYSKKSGDLSVRKKGDLLTLNFPSDTLREVSISDELNACFDIHPQKAYKGKTDYLLIFKNEAEIKILKPNIQTIANIEARGVIVSAKGDKVDFVSRFFGPQVGVDEDPVTGSAHTTLTPYWANQLGKSTLEAIQLSKRQGKLVCRQLVDRVEISGTAKLYLKGEVFLS